jgi:hypothetical protein
VVLHQGLHGGASKAQRMSRVRTIMQWLHTYSLVMVPSLFRFAPFPVDIWKGCHIVLVDWNVVLLSHGLFTENDGKVGCQNGS